MINRCPNCRARRDEGETCRRCGMALAGLIAVEAAAEAAVGRAARHLAAGKLGAAKRELAQAIALRRTPLAERLLGFVRELDAADHA